MSLIRVRRKRREEHRGPNRPPRLWRLLIGMILVILLLWWLGQFG
jgi:amino acid transporter